MTLIQILIAGNSDVVQRLLRKHLGDDPIFEVIGIAATGQVAQAKFSTMRPDLVILGTQLPDRSPLDVLASMRAIQADLPIIMLSAGSRACTDLGMQALMAGANDCVKLPKHHQGDEVSLLSILDTLKDLIRDLCPRGAYPTAQAAPPPAPLSKPRTRPKSPVGGGSRVSLVVIGSSTGGPPALLEVLAGLPVDFPVPILIAQHIAQGFGAALAESLDRKVKLHVDIGRQGMALKPGLVLVAPGDRHMLVEKLCVGLKVRISQDRPLNFCRPSVDILYESVAKACGTGVLGVMLTGMGTDGTAGAKAIVSKGGRMIVQDQQTSAIWGMPGSIANEGLADEVLPLGRIASRIISRVKIGRVSSPVNHPRSNES